MNIGRLEGNRAYSPPSVNPSGKRKNLSSDEWNRPQNSQKRPKNSFKTDDHVPYHPNSNGQSLVSYTGTSEGQKNSGDEESSDFHYGVGCDGVRCGLACGKKDFS